MRSSRIVSGFGGVVLILLSYSVIAAPKPQGIEMGAGKLIPMLKISAKVDDNIFSQSTREEDSLITQIIPQIQFLAEKDEDHFAITYSGDYGFYDSSSEDDYDDHTLSLDALFSPTDLYSVAFGASFGKLHDNRGEGSSEGIIAASRTSPDEYDIDSVNLLLDFGRESAQFGIEAEAGKTIIKYTNNRAETAFRDRNEKFFAGRFYGRAGGKTKYFVEFVSAKFVYDTDPIIGAVIDSEQDVVSIGATWDVTGKTTGSIKVGRLDKDFQATGRRDADITVWDVDITWSPRTYSHVLISASSDAKETNGTGSFIESQDFTIMWLHGWSDRLHSTVVVSVGDDEFNANIRQDDRNSFSIGLSYDWQRWATFSVNYSYIERDSNINIFDFEKNVFTVSLDMSL